MRDMRKFALIGLSISLLWVSICTAQTSNNLVVSFKISDEAFNGVAFSAALDVQAVVVGDTNIIRCKIVNNSSNAIIFTASQLRVCLTNSSGNGYEFDAPPREIRMGVRGPEVSALSFEPIFHGESRVWSVKMIVKDDVQQGDYKFEARQIVLQTNAMCGAILSSGSNLRVITKSD